MAKKKCPVLFDAPPASREENLRLYPKVVAGDKEARDAMILGNMALVTSKVSACIEYFPECEHLKEDLLSAGYLAVVMAVDEMVGNAIEKPNPTGHISKAVFYDLGELLDRESCIRVPRRTFLRKREEGNEIRVPAKEGSLTADDVLQRDGQRDPRQMVDLWDELVGCCENDIEIQIMELRVEGRADAEIAEVLGIPKTTTYMMRRGIYARFLTRNPEINGEA